MNKQDMQVLYASSSALLFLLFFFLFLYECVDYVSLSERDSKSGQKSTSLHTDI